MRGILRWIAAGGVAAFFFFSWILQLLWNSILFSQLQLVPVHVTYWQSAGLWFFVTILFAWTGFASTPRRRFSTLGGSDWRRLGDRIERKVKARISDWSATSDHDLEDRIEARIKHGFSKWVGVGEDMDWDDLGEHIERKIKRHLRDWLNEDS
jgi:hypothetical protein